MKLVNYELCQLGQWCVKPVSVFSAHLLCAYSCAEGCVLPRPRRVEKLGSSEGGIWESSQMSA